MRVTFLEQVQRVTSSTIYAMGFKRIQEKEEPETGSAQTPTGTYHSPLNFLS
jgi:hypothetical protein